MSNLVKEPSDRQIIDSLKMLHGTLRMKFHSECPDHAWIGPSTPELAIECIDRLQKENERHKKALSLALYYVEGDATWEALKLQIAAILDGESEGK